MTKDGTVVESGPPKKTRLLGSVGGLCQFEKHRLSKVDVAEIQSDLAIWNKTEEQNEIIYWETDDFLLTPRDYGVRKFGLSAFMNCMNEGTPIEVEFKKTLDPRRQQDRLVTEALKQMKPGRGGCLHAGTGIGKTVCALYIIAQLKRTAVVLVHSEFLADQWVERAKEYLGFTDAEIGRVQRSQCDYQGKKLVLGVVESMALSVRGKREDYPEEFYNWAGVLILDELHRYSAKTWHLACARFPAAYRLGLTATPKRADGMEPVIFAHTGPVITSAVGTMLDPKITMIVRDKKYSRTAYCLIRGGRISNDVNMAKLINTLAEDDERNADIAKDITDDLVEGRQIIVLSDRLEQLRKLEAMTRANLAERVKAGETEDKHWTLAQFVGGLKKDVRDAAAKADCRFSTWAFAAEGVDIPVMDSLVQATPRTNVEQGIGRILREWQGKGRPRVRDYVDSPMVCQALANKRLAFYESQKWPIKVI